jgi:glucosamine-6-phosphate deaminase
MNIHISENGSVLGIKAAATAAKVVKKSIDEKGYARIVLSTGASQFETLQALVAHDIDWSKVEMFHLDEYIGLSESHPASFRKYLKERFLAFANVSKAHLVDGEGDVRKAIRNLSEEIRKDDIDLALIGIGENAHIAFNDPPADFATKEAYIVVDLDEACKRQQVGEGWFATPADVPDQAISMSVHQILQSKTIVSCVPRKVKAKAIRDTIEQDVTNTVPATILKTHADWSLFLDEESASELQPDFAAPFRD